ncbi:MAG TPA: MBL fold metallo-hydrolase [Spirochaetia bacterium]|nr:MBL fold metallo-hydrolase [Spirochaetia bacterium]
MVERVVVGPWKTNCYIYSSSKKECIIVDPGGDEEEIASRVDVLNMVPIGIALTHGHIDHLAALGRLQANYESRGYTLPVAISSADRRFLGSGALEAHKESLETHELVEFASLAGDAPELPKADVRLKEGDRVFDMDLVVLETPGHTPGSLCFYSEKEGVLFSGDTLFFDGVGRTDLPGGSEKKLRESIEKKIAVLPPETRVFPGHGPFTTVERERRGNPFFRQPAPEPKQLERGKRALPAKPPKRRIVRKAKASRPPVSRRVRTRVIKKSKTKPLKLVKRRTARSKSPRRATGKAPRVARAIASAKSRKKKGR